MPVVEIVAVAPPADVIVKPPTTKHPYWAVPGGCIVWSGESLDAHCGSWSHHDKKNPCRLNRPVLPLDPYSKVGRPVGLLLAWLSHQSECATRALHKNSVHRRKARSIDKEGLSLEIRQFKREWCNVHFPIIIEKEREQRKGSPHRPRGIDCNLGKQW